MPSPTEEMEVSSENVDKLSDTKSHPQVTDPKPNTESMIETESIQEKKTENSKEGARLECKNYFISHCVKSVQIRSHFWSVFSRIQTEYGKILSLRIQSECGKIRTRNNSVFGHSSHAVSLSKMEWTEWVEIF